MNPPVVPPCVCGGALAAVSYTRDVAAQVEEWEFQCSSCGKFSSCLAPFSYQLLAEPKPTPTRRPAPEPERSISGSVIGYRAFRFLNWKLGGTGVNRMWEPGVNRATCDSGTNPAWMGGLSSAVWTPNSHDAPGEGCHCGITALARFTTKDERWSGDLVHGAIEAWGEDTDTEPGSSPGFILHHNGFRARYGKVVLLAIDDDWPAAKRAAVRALAAEHEADVCRIAHLEDAAKEHGQLVPDELLEWARDEPASRVGQSGSGYFIPPLNAYAYLQLASTPPTTWSISTAATPPGTLTARGVSKRAKGIRETIGYPGPPAHGKYRRHDRVRDSKRNVWTCTRGGEPGVWEAESDTERKEP